MRRGEDGELWDILSQENETAGDGAAARGVGVVPELDGLGLILAEPHPAPEPCRRLGRDGTGDGAASLVAGLALAASLFKIPKYCGKKF